MYKYLQKVHIFVQKRQIEKGNLQTPHGNDRMELNHDTFPVKEWDPDGNTMDF